MLKKILDDIRAKVDLKLVPKDRKIFLYSVHEFNLAYLLLTLDVFEYQNPPYGAYILFEVHEIDNVYGIKVRVLQLL